MPLWYQNYYIWSHVWDVCEVTVILVNSITMRSQCCHSMMSHMHKMTTSPWGCSVGTVWCHRYCRWPQHHEVTVLSQDNAHHVRVIMMSLCFRNYDITSQWYKLTASPWAHMQCCQRTMLTMRGHFDVPMISKLWHQMCELFVRSCWYKLTASPWGHRMMLIMLGHFGVPMISKLWHHICELFVRSQWLTTNWPHHHDVVVLSQYDISDTQDDHITMRRSQCCHSVMSQIHGDDHITMRSQCCHSVMSQINRDDHITMSSQCCHRMMLTMWGHYDIPVISKLWHHMCECFVRSQWYKLSTSHWCHSVVTGRCSQPYDISHLRNNTYMWVLCQVTVILLMLSGYDITCCLSHPHWPHIYNFVGCIWSKLLYISYKKGKAQANVSNKIKSWN